MRAKILATHPDYADIVDAVFENEQHHVFRFWDDLSYDERTTLLDQLERIDFSLVNLLTDAHILHTTEPEQQEFSPSRAIKQDQNRERARIAGEKLLRAGKVAVFLVAGGQGSRLGFDGPKGSFPISPINNKSLFQLHAERILSNQKRFESIIPWYIMTSDQNHDATMEFFEKHNYFGLQKENIMFFKQGMLPSLDTKGNLMLESKSQIFMNPDGHGGSIKALNISGAIEDMESRSIEQIFYYQVDNALVKMVDPIFIGHHVLANAEMSTKVVRKTDPDEKVGVVGYINDKLGIIEYSMMSKEQVNEKNPDGSLRFKNGNIAIHILSLNFIKHLHTDEFSLPFNKAHKKIPYLDNFGKKIHPEEPNGIKFESFIFDALKRVNSSIIFEVNRHEEFAPIKNAKGSDSPSSAKQMQINLYAEWLEHAGVHIPRKEDNTPDCLLEISPLYALNEAELKEKIDKTGITEVKPGQSLLL